MKTQLETKNITQLRKVDHPIESIFVDRWSPRAMSGEQITKNEFNSLLEAARWAPSTANMQPWKFVYAFKNSNYWNTFFNLLAPGNQTWVEKGSVLILIASKKTYGENKISKTSAFDAGLAYENFALQGSQMHLVVHAMGGFNYEKARLDLHIPEEYEILAMSVVGKPGNISDLPALLQSRETPSGRVPLSEFSKEGVF